MCAPINFTVTVRPTLLADSCQPANTVVSASVVTSCRNCTFQPGLRTKAGLRGEPSIERGKKFRNLKELTPLQPPPHPHPHHSPHHSKLSILIFLILILQAQHPYLHHSPIPTQPRRDSRKYDRSLKLLNTSSMACAALGNVRTLPNRPTKSTKWWPKWSARFLPAAGIYHLSNFRLSEGNTDSPSRPNGAQMDSPSQPDAPAKSLC